jgi:hypothetical protein
VLNFPVERATLIHFPGWPTIKARSPRPHLLLS